MGWRIRRNDLPEIIAALPREVDDAVQVFGRDLAEALNTRVWKDTGILQRTVEPTEQRLMHVQVQIGIYLGHGFYSGFQEFGTSRQAARPVVVPTALESEPVFANYVTNAVKRACRA
jgi:hypothetical protein